MKPRVCILKTEGTNCDAETLYAFKKVGAATSLVHINQLKEGEQALSNYQILAIPGGFSHGDDVHSGKILSVELMLLLKEQLTNFVQQGNLIIGICNGFQVLTNTGLLPQGQLSAAQVSLMANDSGRFECRWVHLKVEKSNCVFTRDMEGNTVQYQVAHGEGKFYARPPVLKQLEQDQQVVLRYVEPDSKVATQQYPANPNGSLQGIAGICDPTGRILGLMPHPERFVEFFHHPNWRRQSNHADQEPQGVAIFRNAVNYARANLC